MQNIATFGYGLEHSGMGAVYHSACDRANICIRFGRAVVYLPGSGRIYEKEKCLKLNISIYCFTNFRGVLPSLKTGKNSFFIDNNKISVHPYLAVKQ